MSNQVYICQFALDRVQQYDIKASVKDSGFLYPEIRDILESRVEPDTYEIEEKKEKYFPFAVELSHANHFFKQNKTIPDALWAGIYQNEAIKLPTHEDYIFSIWSGGILFNPSCAAILKQHRLGDNILTPVQIYDLSTGCLASDETYYFLNLYERREYICETQSNTKLQAIPTNDGVMSFSGYIYNQDIDVYQSVLGCDVDLWYDPRLGSHFFMSANLHHALSEVGMIDKFSAYTCNLIE